MSISLWAGSFREQRIRQIDLETELGCQLATATCEKEGIQAVIIEDSSFLPVRPLSTKRHKPQYAGGGG